MSFDSHLIAHISSFPMEQLHMLLFPGMADGHMIPMLDMAKLFTSRGIKTTIFTTPAFAAAVTKARQSGHDIGLTVADFPPKGSSLPDGITSFDHANTPNLLSEFHRATELLQEPLESFLQELKPNCLVSDWFLPWTADSAAKFRIPRLVFYGYSCFSRCLATQMRLQKPYNNVSSDSEPFALTGLPHQLTFVGSQIPPFDRQEKESIALSKFLHQLSESANKTYGEIVNTFYELESPYFDHFKNALGRKAWPVGPLSLCSASKEIGEGEKSMRGNESAIDEHKCLPWLDGKSPNSVVYVCFGSSTSFTKAQLHETAAGLEASAQDFIWAVKKGKNHRDEDMLPQGFEERVEGKGLIIRGWAPQLMILNHHAIGAFVTHCGWNSILEGICAGVPMITWPVFAEQFYNEKLVTEVLQTGVSVGNKRWMRMDSEGVGRDAVAEAVKQVVVGGGAAEMRSRAAYYKEMAKKAVEVGGSSYNSLNALIEELNTYVPPTQPNMT